jgi:hypothetical protein
MNVTTRACDPSPSQKRNELDLSYGDLEKRSSLFLKTNLYFAVLTAIKFNSLRFLSDQRPLATPHLFYMTKVIGFVNIYHFVKTDLV